jgi:hypothetical protein
MARAKLGVPNHCRFFAFYRGLLAAEPVSETLTGCRVISNLFPMLGIAPQLGRAFVPSDEAADAPRVVMISDAFWRRAFGADPTASAERCEAP